LNDEDKTTRRMREHNCLRFTKREHVTVRPSIAQGLIVRAGAVEFCGQGKALSARSNAGTLPVRLHLSYTVRGISE